MVPCTKQDDDVQDDIKVKLTSLEITSSEQQDIIKQ